MDKVVMNAWQPDPCVSAGPSSSSSSCSRQPMELLCRSWSFSAFDISKALLPPPPTAGEYHHFSTSHDDHHLQVDPHNNNATPPSFSGNPFSFASSETSQMVMARIMSQSREVSPRTSGRLSHSSGPLTDSPPESPSEIIDELKLMQLGSRAGGGANNDNKVGGIGNQRLKFPATGGSLGGGGGGGRTVGRWLKDRKEKRREETRAHNAQLHAAMSVAGLAASVASIAAATAAASSSSSSSNNNEEDKMMMRAKTDMAVASAAALVAAQCVEAAESMGVDRDLLASVLASAVRVRSPSDIVTLTAAAATALRGAATLKARALKEVWNIAAVIPSSSSSDKFVAPPPPGAASSTSSSTSNSGEFLPEDHNFLGICSRELLARGSELLKRTRKGDLHWKIVSVYINRLNQVMLKMKSRHVAGTFTKKKKNVVMEVVRDMPSWAGRHLLEGGEHRRYFGLKTVGRGLVEFECKNQRQYDIWTQGVSRLLSLAAQRRS